MVKTNECTVQYKLKTVFSGGHEHACDYAKQLSKKGRADVFDYTGALVATYENGKLTYTEDDSIPVPAF